MSEKFEELLLDLTNLGIPIPPLALLIVDIAIDGVADICGDSFNLFGLRQSTIYAKDLSLI